ncbi:unknown [Prevotella sp. CAG:1031]|nr:unknown [Prevotella sp. CAG:1031]
MAVGAHIAEQRRPTPTCRRNSRQRGGSRRHQRRHHRCGRHHAAARRAGKPVALRRHDRRERMGRLCESHPEPARRQWAAGIISGDIPRQRFTSDVTVAAACLSRRRRSVAAHRRRQHTGRSRTDTDFRRHYDLLPQPDAEAGVARRQRIGSRSGREPSSFRPRTVPAACVAAAS